MKIIVFSCLLVLLALQWSDRTEGQALPALINNNQPPSPNVNKPVGVPSAGADPGNDATPNGSQSSDDGKNDDTPDDTPDATADDTPDDYASGESPAYGVNGDTPDDYASGESQSTDGGDDNADTPDDNDK